jgi:hypothetical protein
MVKLKTTMTSKNQNVGPYPHINVEEYFNALVREYGGAVVLEETLPYPRTFPNADYVFHSEKIVAELKCLQVDNVDSDNNQVKIKAAVDYFYDAGKITSKNIDENTWPKLPKELTDRIYEITTKAIQARIRKARHQIAETKQKLGLQSYAGYLIIVNEGIFSLPPAAFIMAIVRVLDTHREIDHFIFFSANVFTKIRNVPMPLMVVLLR